MQAQTAHPRRRAIHLAMALFAASMLIPAYRIFRDFMPGYSVAWHVEGVFWKFSWKSAEAGFGLSSAIDISRGDLNMLTGATANHLFLLAYGAALFRRIRTAAILAVASCACALGCLLPWQLWEFDHGWFLGPGYFVWCAAPMMLSYAMVRAVHRAIWGQSEPLFRGLLSSPTVK